MLIKNHKPLAAISYDTQTYSQLQQFIATEEGQELVRIDPNDFLANPSKDYQYINLVVKDFDQRKQVSALLDQLSLDRFTYVDRTHQSVLAVRPGEKFKIGLGCFLYPSVFGYSGSIGKDVIIHSMTRLAENVAVGDGCFISGSVTVAGSCKIGNWCFIGNNVFLIDNIELTDNVRLLPGMGIRKSINQSGTYYNPNVFECKQIE